jgi:large subunit ribosomal protein L21
MHAVVRIAGTQVQVTKGQQIRVPKLALDPGAAQAFPEVLLVSSEAGILVGQPTVDGALVQTTVVGHGRGPKIVVFKMKRRKKYRRRNGHRQDFTELRVEDIVLPN